MKILIANSNPVHEELVRSLKTDYRADSVSTPETLKAACLATQYDYVFFPHWSFIIPASVYEKSECVLFHMTDLPYGRGGSPLQNLIVRGHTSTMITAIRVSKGLDTGPVYTKKNLSLMGTAREIFMRTSLVLKGMIQAIISKRPSPAPQTGDVVVFQRRKPEDGDLAALGDLPVVYDFIRMLDADGYPPAFLETENLRFEFTRASHYPSQIVADVRITKK